jgi:hypothetical protein
MTTDPIFGYRCGFENRKIGKPWVKLIWKTRMYDQDVPEIPSHPKWKISSRPLEGNIWIQRERGRGTDDTDQRENGK